MQQTLEDFYKVIRAAGIKVSPSDTIETSRTVALVGYSDRDILRNAFQVSLAKSETEQNLVAECFDQFFSFDTFSAANDPRSDNTAEGNDAINDQQAATSEQNEVPQAQSELAKMLLEGDTASLATEMKKAAREVGLTDIWFFTQKSLYAQKIMQKMGLRDLQNDIAAMGKGDCPSSIAQAGELRDRKSVV